MAKASELNPRFYQELISKIEHNEPYYDMFDKYTPQAIRDMIEEAQAEYTKGTHPFDLYEKPELVSKIPIKEVPNLPNYGEFNLKAYKATGLPALDHPMEILVKDRRDLGTLGHEVQHAYDTMSQPNVVEPMLRPEPQSNLLSRIKQELEIPRKILTEQDLRGLEETSAYYGKHFKPDVEDKFGKLKQLLNLERVVKGQPLKAVAPLVKAAGVGALGMAASSIANKAMAGDVGEAALEAADVGTDFIPVVGEIKTAVRPSELGGAELPPEVQEEKERFNKLRQRLLNK